MQNLLTQFIGDFLTAAALRALDTDPATRARLGELEGKRVAIRTTAPPTPLDITWQVEIYNAQLDISTQPALNPHVEVVGTPWDIIAWLVPGGANPALTINGDVALLEHFRQVLSEFAPDLAQPLSQLVGNQAAATLAGTAEMGMRTLQSLAQGISHSFQQSTTDHFVDQENLDKLLSGMDKLRLDIDRLAQRLKNAEAQSQ